MAEQKPASPNIRMYVLYIDGEGVKTIEFTTEKSRQDWLHEKDDTFDDFYCLDIKGQLHNVYAALVGQQRTS